MVVWLEKQLRSDRLKPEMRMRSEASRLHFEVDIPAVEGYLHSRVAFLSRRKLNLDCLHQSRR
jgi:hypothetical protein